MRSVRGLSLVELMVVVALVAAITAVAATAMTGGLAGRELRAAARDVAAELRFTRARAIASGRAQTFRLDVDSREWSSVDKRQGRLPEGIEVIATSARPEQPANRVAAIRFFPEGAATGGRIVLARGDAKWRVDVAWLTGEVTLNRGGGER